MIVCSWSTFLVLYLLAVVQNIEKESFLSHTALNNSIAFSTGRIGNGNF